eukprot:GDKK01022757.1.p1 GENE.GDKK01022757.1~~GDKK01022757.1.p1  ORF type:complete len:358 (+),score=58.71 GDKK01022757.1:16-1089(+)
MVANSAAPGSVFSKRVVAKSSPLKDSFRPGQTVQSSLTRGSVASSVPAQSREAYLSLKEEEQQTVPMVLQNNSGTIENPPISYVSANEISNTLYSFNNPNQLRYDAIMSSTRRSVSPSFSNFTPTNSSIYQNPGNFNNYMVNNNSASLHKAPMISSLESVAQQWNHNQDYLLPSPYPFTQQHIHVGEDPFEHHQDHGTFGSSSNGLVLFPPTNDRNTISHSPPKLISGSNTCQFSDRGTVIHRPTLQYPSSEKSNSSYFPHTQPEKLSIFPNTRLAPPHSQPPKLTSSGSNPNSCNINPPLSVRPSVTQAINSNRTILIQTTGVQQQTNEVSKNNSSRSEEKSWQGLGARIAAAFHW